MGAHVPLTFPLAFAALDWVVLVVDAGTLLGIVFYFCSRQSGTTEEFFAGNRRTSPLLAGTSRRSRRRSFRPMRAEISV